MHYIIIGSGTAGTNAAFTIRKEDPEAQITLIGSESKPLYSRVNISKILDHSKSVEDLYLKTSQQYEDARIEYLHTSVESIQEEAKQIMLPTGESLSYDKLVIATGGRARQLTISGVELNNVYSFQTLEDAQSALGSVQKAQRIVVIGGGFIGIEFVELLSKMNKDIHLILREQWYWQGMVTQEGGQYLDRYLQERAQVHYATECARILGDNGSVTAVELKSGEIISADVVFIGIGLVLNTEHLPTRLIKRGLVVNQYLQSDNPDIFAAGDIAEYYDIYQQGQVTGGTWAGASLQGMIAGYNAVHTDSMKPFDFIPAFTPKISLPVAFVGSCRILDGVEVHILEQSENRYIHLMARESVIIGGMVIGDSSLMGKISKAIKEHMPIEEWSVV